MKKQLFLICILCTLTQMGSVARACWAAPPAFSMGTSANAEYSFHRNNRTGTITITQTEKPEVELWRSTLNGFSGLFSDLQLSDDGQSLVHVRNNHQVNNLEDVAIEVIRKDGSRATLPASAFIDELGEPPQPMESTSPGKMWLSSFGGLTDTGLSLTNANGDKKVILLKDLDFKPAS